MRFLLLLVLATTQLTHAEKKSDDAVRESCLAVLREGLKSEEFWPAMHAAEALSLAGKGDEVIAALEPKLEEEKDDQKRCGLARELVRAGDRDKAAIMLDILRGDDPHGHVHAAESLYKVGFDGDEAPLVKHFRTTKETPLLLMTAAALAKHGNDEMKKEAYTVLRAQLQTKDDPNVLRISSWILGRIGNESDIAGIRAHLPTVKDPLIEAFLYQSLALLGDPEARKQLLTNLQSEDAAIRTYAAVFSGEAGIDEAIPFLTKQLNDENLDARIRAAQALIVLSQ